MSADNVALPAFADGRAAIDPYRLVVGSTAANPQHATAGWDRRTDGRLDGRTPDSCIDAAPHTM